VAVDKASRVSTKCQRDSWIKVSVQRTRLAKFSVVAYAEQVGSVR
jgi:hypothetical protein